jgi:uncharacterized protein (UPF0333 family)
MEKKSQAAMEFMLVYGWAILIVLLIVSVIAYFGFFNINKFLPNVCEFPAGFECIDWTISGETNIIELAMRNKLGALVNITDVKLMNQENGCTDINKIQVDNNDVPYGVANNAFFRLRIECSGGLASGRRFRSDPIINYTYVATGTVHSSSGSLRLLIS